MQTTTVGVFADRIDAEAAARELRELGILDTDISYVEEPKTRGSATAVVRMSIFFMILGMVIGGAVGFGVVSGVGVVPFSPEIARALALPLPYAAIVSGALLGLLLGVILGALLGGDSDVPRSQRLRASSVLLIIHTLKGNMRTVLEKYRPREIREYVTPA